MSGAGRAAVLTGAREPTWQDVPAAPPAPGTVTVEVRLCGICGTEVASYRTGSLHSPAVSGHEWVGTVAAVGDGVTSVAEGDRVVASVPGPCGRCPEGLAGLADTCRHGFLIARGRDALAPTHGGFAPRLTVSAERVLQAHPALSDVQAAHVEPAAVVFHALRRVRPAPGDTVVVQGAGPIGLLAAQLARALGAGAVLVVEPSAARRDLARALGATAVLEPGAAADEAVRDATRGLGADLVLECAGAPGLLRTAVALARRGGTVGLLGHSPGTAAVDAGTWLAKEVTVRGAVAFAREDAVRAMQLLADGRLRVEELVTATVPLSALGDALEDLSRPGSAQVKVLVDPAAG